MTGDEISPYKDFFQKQNGRFLAGECALYACRARGPRCARAVVYRARAAARAPRPGTRTRAPTPVYVVYVAIAICVQRRRGSENHGEPIYVSLQIALLGHNKLVHSSATQSWNDVQHCGIVRRALAHALEGC